WSWSATATTTWTAARRTGCRPSASRGATPNRASSRAPGWSWRPSTSSSRRCATRRCGPPRCPATRPDAASRLARDPAVLVDLPGGREDGHPGRGLGPPPGDRHEPRLDPLEPGEERGDLVRLPVDVDRAAGLAELLLGLELLLGDGAVADGEVAARRHAARAVRAPRPRPGGVGEVPEPAEDRHGDRLLEVEDPLRAPEDAVDVADVGLEAGGLPLGRADGQRPGVREHERVVVDVDDPALRGDPLRHLVGVVRRREPGADVEELADAGLARQELHDPPQETPRLPRVHPDLRVDRGDGVTRLPVDGVVVLAAEEVVPDARRMRDGRVDPGAGVGRGRLLAHRGILADPARPRQDRVCRPATPFLE